MDQIKLDCISKQYHGKQIFKQFSYVFEKGKTYLLLGTSGIGKTTLIRMILKLETLDEGNITYIEPIKTAVVFQNPAFCDDLSVWINLKMVCKNPQQIQKIAQLVKKMGLNIDLRQKIQTCSGGERQRIAIVRALLVESDLLIFDEALKQLDQKTKDQVMDVIQKECQDKTILWVTHDESERRYFQDPINIVL